MRVPKTDGCLLGNQDLQGCDEILERAWLLRIKSRPCVKAHLCASAQRDSGGDERDRGDNSSKDEHSNRGSQHHGKHSSDKQKHEDRKNRGGHERASGAHLWHGVFGVHIGGRILIFLGQ